MTIINDFVYNNWVEFMLLTWIVDVATWKTPEGVTHREDTKGRDPQGGHQGA